MNLEKTRRLLDTAIADGRPITPAQAEACRAEAARLRAAGFPQGAQSIADRLAALPEVRR